MAAEIIAEALRTTEKTPIPTNSFLELKRTLVKCRKRAFIELLAAKRSSENLSASQRLRGNLALVVTVILFALSGAVDAQTAAQAKALAELEQEVAAQVRLLSDWGGLTRYGSENADLGPPPPGVDRVVFLGDEITEMWGKAKGKFFPGKPFLNRGISHQTTPQMLVRFRQDVISLKPKVVVIQAGSSDLAGYSGPATEGTISENFMSMTELAKINGIRVVLSSVTPVCDCFKVLTERRPPGKILGLNRWLKDYAARSGSEYLDYYSVLAEGKAMKRDLTVDGLVPNEAGYALMAPLAERAIAQALSLE